MPLLYKSETPLLGVWKITETTGELLQLIDRPEAHAALQEVAGSEARTKERLAVLVLLKTLLGREATIGHRENGAPFLPDEPLRISLSHTKGYAAVLLSENRNPGIDIEYRSDRVNRIHHRFLGAEENAFISAGHETEHRLICWCAKETLFKAIGQSGVDLIRHLHIRPFPFQSQGILCASESRSDRQEEFRIAFRVESDFVLTYTLSDTGITPNPADE